MISVVGARYARALVDAALSPGFGGDPRSVMTELSLVESEIAQSTDLKAALKNPSVSSAKKRAVLGRLAKQLNLSRYVTNFLFVAVTKGRLKQLAEIREAYEQLLDERLGFARVMVSSARDLTEEERARLEVQLIELTGKKVNARYLLDPSLVGGVIARVGSTVYDGSIRGQMEALRRKLVH